MTTTGDALQDANFPLIHTVGRAAARAPRLVELTWGDEGPALTLVGKGVCFDTGGLNLKPGGSMALMKKDMGGAATVLGLAQMIMASGMRLRLRVLVPAVENAVSGDAFRPGDVLTARDGTTVELVFGEPVTVATAESTSNYALQPATAVSAALLDPDTVTTTLNLVEKIDDRKRIRFAIESTNQRGEVVMVGDLVEQAL